MPWVEVAEGVFQRRYDPLDVSVCIVRGRDGLLLVDTRSCPREADEIRADLAELGDLPVRWLVNTHAHYDHTFGNQCFGHASDLGVPIYGHRRLPAHLDEFERPRLAAWRETHEEPGHDWGDVVITPPDHLVDERLVLDVGGRAVELLHLGRGHTDNDLLIHVPDAHAWLVGDVVEESGPPMYGSGSFPLEWPTTVARLLTLLRDTDVVVPGHGRAVARGDVTEQHVQLQSVTALIQELYSAGVPEQQAVATGGSQWPYPAHVVEPAIAGGYRQLRSARYP